MTKKNLKYGIIGSGSWATAIIKILSENLQEINWYIRNKNNVDYIVNLRLTKILNNPSDILLINKDGSIKIIR